MISILDRAPVREVDPREAQTAAMVDYLRGIVLAEPAICERFHAIFLDSAHTFIADASMGDGKGAYLKLRLRELFSKALAVDARGLIIAHNHPSGDCRPSQIDIEETSRLKNFANALDIELIDHLIVTKNAIYSMRAGGQL
ncbi:JAB domain-containing protein [Erythrobacter crassostreae]|uniref:DNA repair protein n=1 Tax=Erythrobacter crassostreae TaxID=2828328 RepID=A0A9X1F137_9SPHN|nr:JAB domain-containing protein [Erythrobacter crassostrea]MBV7258122.1 DNA repair protein [Erythrobacter crassostrea]